MLVNEHGRDEKNHITKHNLLICSPYISQDALDDILSLYGITNLTSSTDFSLKILFRGNIEEFTQGSSDITTLDTLLSLSNSNNNCIKRIKNLHMKAYLIDESELLITSGNLTRSGMYVISQTENFEGGLFTDEKNVIDQFLNYFTAAFTLDVYGHISNKMKEQSAARMEEYLNSLSTVCV